MRQKERLQRSYEWNDHIHYVIAKMASKLPNGTFSEGKFRNQQATRIIENL